VRLTVPKQVQTPYLVGGQLDVRVTPVDYTGRVTARDPDGRLVGSASAADGHARLTLRAQDLGKTRLQIKAGTAPGFTGASGHTVQVSSPTVLMSGDRDPVVPILLRRLRRAHYLTPETTKRFSKPVSDVVLAFQKVNGLPRTAQMDLRTWRAFADAGPVKARSRSRGTHLEVDKTRQVMMLVTNGKVRGTLHVSTGATGNTPVGKWRIYAKGIGYLYRFMPFKGNFGIHGYVPVPPYPASHGCVREPMWAADWTYDRVSVGTRVIVYP
jgi:hypothetical protein